MPPDDPERSELDDALFGGSGDHPAANPTPPPPEDEDLTDLDSELFGESTVARQLPPETPATRPRRSGRGRRFGLGVLVVLLVVGLGGVAYAVFGSEDTKTPVKAKVEVRGSEVTRTTLRTTT